MNSNYGLLVLLVFLMALSISPKVAAWELEKDAQQVQVYSRDTESGYVELKAIIWLEAKAQDVVMLLSDPSSCAQWVPHCQRVQSLDMANESEFVIQTFFDAPWPMQDRDMVTHNAMVVDPSGRIISVVVSDQGAQWPLVDGHVRMERISGKWTIDGSRPDKIQVIYQGYGEAGGAMPAWLANHIAIKSIHQTFVNLRASVNKHTLASAVTLTGE